MWRSEWRQLPPLREARSGCRAVWAGSGAGGRIVVLGGHGSADINRGGTLSSVESLALGAQPAPGAGPEELATGGAWEALPPMLAQRSHFGCAPLPGGAIAVAGGCGERGAVIDLAEVYEPDTPDVVGGGGWRELPRLPDAAEGCSLAFVPNSDSEGGVLLLLGCGSGCLALTLSAGGSDAWAGVGAQPRVPRAFGSVFAAAGSLWVVGGRTVATTGEEQDQDCTSAEHISIAALRGEPQAEKTGWGSAGGWAGGGGLKLGAVGAVAAITH